MKTAKEIVQEINAANLVTASWASDEVDMDGFEAIATQDREEHRWYTLGVVVFQRGLEFIGVEGPVLLKSETMSWSDIEYKCKAFEMEVIPSVAYRKKEQGNG